MVSGMGRITTCVRTSLGGIRSMNGASSHYFIIAKIEVKRYRARWLYRNWYYTLGDTDLV